jgi:hypothetical protein
LLIGANARSDCLFGLHANDLRKIMSNRFPMAGEFSTNLITRFTEAKSQIEICQKYSNAHLDQSAPPYSKKTWNKQRKNHSRRTTDVSSCNSSWRQVWPRTHSCAVSHELCRPSIAYVDKKLKRDRSFDCFRMKAYLIESYHT